MSAEFDSRPTLSGSNVDFLNFFVELSEKKKFFLRIIKLSFAYRYANDLS